MDKGMDIDLRRCLLALHAAACENPRVAHRLVSRFRRRYADHVRPGAALAAVRRYARGVGLEPDWRSADAAVGWAAGSRCCIVMLHEPAYPPLLAELPDAPPVLFVHGHPEVLRRPQVAIVGSRKGSPSGCEISVELARELGRRGLVITSGLAYGIDAAAHRGALSVGGPTIAVLGSGIDRLYPRRHARLAEQIRETGAVVSEFPMGSPPRAHHFPRRNRLISGLTRGTVVVEAAASSGSLITAMHAADQGREVFAVPGSIRNPLSRGCHALIKQGAKLVESASDIIDEIGHFGGLDASREQPGTVVSAGCETISDIGRQESLLLEACGFEPTTIDALVSRSGLTAIEVSSMLLRLELKGHIESCSGASFVRKGSG